MEVWRLNLQDAWAALRMIRETVETLAPIGAMPAPEYSGVTLLDEADVIVAGIMEMDMRTNALNLQQKLQAERIKIAKVRIMLMDIKQYADHPAVKKHAEDALAILNDPVEKYIGPKK